MIRLEDLRARCSPVRYSTPAIDPVDTRGVFKADADRVLFCQHFRLLADKTQVHGPSGNPYTRSRLTHSLEVSRVGASLGLRLAQMLPGEDPRLEDFSDIVAASGLLHDVGNPPFGHTGEDIMSQFFREDPLGQSLIADLDRRDQTQFTHFEGNAQALRIATRIGGWREEGGLGLTAATLAAFAKYPFAANPRVGTEKVKHKYGIFAQDIESFAFVAEHTQTPLIAPGRWGRHPLAYLSEAADDICYNIVDLEDAAQLGVISVAEAEDLLTPLVGEAARERQVSGIRRLAFLRSRAISQMIEAVCEILPDHLEQMMDGTHPGDLVRLTRFGDQFQAIGRFSRRYIYANANRRMQDDDAKGILTTILKRTSEALMEREAQGAPLRHPAIEAMNMDEIIPYDRAGWLHVLCDHIVHQTDRSAMSLAQQLS